MSECPKCNSKLKPTKSVTAKIYECLSVTLIENDKFLQSKSCRINELEGAIKKHRAQKADDRCIFDDDELYAVLEDGIKCDRRVGCKADMLKNCERFIENRTEEGGWKSYSDLELEHYLLEGLLRLGRALYGTSIWITVDKQFDGSKKYRVVGIYEPFDKPLDAIEAAIKRMKEG